jgi:hypothetical protein
VREDIRERCKHLWEGSHINGWGDLECFAFEIRSQALNEAANLCEEQPGLINIKTGLSLAGKIRQLKPLLHTVVKKIAKRKVRLEVWVHYDSSTDHQPNPNPNRKSE